MPEDHLDKSISVEAAITKSGIKASAKSRFFSAIDRLLGGCIDWPASYIDGKAQFRRLETEISLKARAAAAEIDLQATNELQRIEYAARIAFETDAVRRRLNAQATAVEALEDLRETPPDHDIQGHIDDDWLNIFASHSENASSERLRNLWGKVLSGEVRKPGTFSLTTLRILSELDQQTANLFMSVLSDLYSDDFLVIDKNLAGTRLVDIITLEDLGFLQYNGGLTLPVVFNDKGEFHTVVGNHILFLTGQPNSEFRFGVAKLTRSGSEILQLIAKGDGRPAIDKIVSQGGNQVLTAKIANVIATLDDGQVRYAQPSINLK